MTINSQNKIDQEIQERIYAANRCYWIVLKLFKRTLLSSITTVRIFAATLQPILYKSEVCTLTKKLPEKADSLYDQHERQEYGE